MGYLDSSPAPEAEFAGEIAAYEKEQAAIAEKPAVVAPETPAEPVKTEAAEETPAVAEVTPKEPVAAAIDSEPDDKAVPYKALREERSKRQAHEKTVSELQQQLHQLQQQAFQQQQPQEQPEADIDETVDPIGALKQMRERFSRIEQERQQVAQENNIKTAYQQAAQQFATQTQDFPDAYQFLVQSRGRELTALGYNAGQINQQLRNEELQLAFDAFQRGANPAQIVYETAMARGYTKKQAAKAAEAVTQPVPTAEEQANTQLAKAAAALSLSPGGKAPTSDLSASDIANMSGDNFDKHFANLAKAAKKQSNTLFRN